MNSAFPPEEQVSRSVGSDGARLERNRVDGGKGSRAASALAEQILTVDASGDVDITAGSRSGQTGVCDAAGAGVISSTVVKEAPPVRALTNHPGFVVFQSARSPGSRRSGGCYS